MASVTARKKRPPHMDGIRVPGKETLTCGECKRRGVPCGGVWRFHSQHGRYIQQCRVCRLKKRSCSFRRFENDDKLKKSPGEQEQATKGRKRGRVSTPISISDSEESHRGDSPVAGPSSRPEKKVRVRSAAEWAKLKETLLEARTRKVEIETEAEIEVAKINSIIEEAEHDLKKVK